MKGQFPASLFLTLFLKVFKLLTSLQSSGCMPHIFGPKNETLLLPWYTDLTSGLDNLEICLKLYRQLPLYLKISFIIGNDRFLLSRHIQ